VKIRIATRKSPLALVQARWVAAELTRIRPGLEVEEVQIVTRGDRIQDRPLSEVGGKGLFVTEIEDALRENRADLAVHSMKDVPAQLAEGLGITCVPVREDPRDVLVSSDGAGLDDLEAFCKIGTSSLRRQAQIRARRNDVICEAVRGNVDTRLRKLDEGQYRAIVLAAAGLRRLGLDHRTHRVLTIEECIPAVGQGALGLETREDDRALIELLAPLDHAETRVAIEAERAFLTRLEGGCQLPLACYARLTHEGARLRIDALVGSSDGAQLITSGSDRYLEDQSPEGKMRVAYQVGKEMAEHMLQKGAGEMLEASRNLAAERGWKH
jgi:hydroxymethylbilane synthase